MNKPFIKLFSYKNKVFFLYDVNRNEIINIDCNTHKLLWDIISGATQAKDADAEIQRLIKAGYLLPDRPQHIEQPLSKYLASYLDRRVNGIVLQVTQSCNLKCKYCIYAINGLYNRKHSSKHMSWATAKKAIDFLRLHSGDLSNVRISFYGGEPMLNMALVEKSVLYAEKTMPYKKITFAMTTNLTVLTDEYLRFLIDHNIKLTISLDGPQEVNDRNRFFAVNGESTYWTVIENMQKLAEHPSYYKKYVQINAVMDKSIDQQYVSDFFSSNHLFKDIDIGYSSIDDSNLKIQYYTSAQYIKRQKLNRLKDMISRAANGSEKYEVFEELDQKLSRKSVPYSMQRYVHHNGPCIPGVKKLFVDTEGCFLPCEKANDQSCHLRIGDVDNGIDVMKANELYNIGKISETQCMTCWAIKLCNCCVVNVDDGKEISKVLKETKCINQKRFLESELIQLGLVSLLRQNIEQ